MINFLRITFILLIIFSLNSFTAKSKKVVFDFSDLSLEHTYKDKSNDYDEYVFKKDGAEIIFKDANWKVADNYYYLKIKKSSTINSYINLTNANAEISRVVFKFHSGSNNNKITYSIDNRDESLDMSEINDSFYSACDVNVSSFYFKSTLGNSLIKEIIVYYTDKSQIETVGSSIEFNNNSNGGVYSISVPLHVFRVEKVKRQYIDGISGEEFIESTNEIYVSDGSGGICISIPDNMIQNDFILPIRGTVLNNLTGKLQVNYNTDDSFSSTPLMVCDDENIITYNIDNNITQELFVITDIEPFNILQDKYLNREFLLSNMELRYIDNAPYYLSLDSSEIIIPIVDKFGALNSLSNESGQANFILSKSMIEGYSYVAYPVEKERLTDIKSFDHLIESEENVRYFDIKGNAVYNPSETGVYIRISKYGVEKIFITN